MKRTRIAIVATIALVFAALVAPTPALAAGTGTVTVQVVSAAGTSLALDDFTIQLYHGHGSAQTYFASDTTNSSGQFTFTGVPAATTLTAHFEGDGAYISNTKSDIEVKSGHTITTDIQAVKGAIVTGTLTAGGSPLANAEVYLWDSNGDSAQGGITNSSGVYGIVVKSGTYRVQFNGRLGLPLESAAQSWAWTYWKGTTSWSSAKTVTVKQQTKSHAATDLTNINGTVSKSQTLNGEVDLSGISSHNYVEFVATHNADSFSTELNNSGDAFSTWVVPGKYRVAVQGNLDPVLGDYPLYWFRGDSVGVTADESKATWVTITANHDVVIDFIDDPADD